MVSRPSLMTKKTKKPRVSRSEGYLINKKYMGEEPTFKGEMSNIDYIRMLNWYNTMCDTGDARDYTREYLKSQGRLDELKKFNSVPDAWVSSTGAWIARMIHRGISLPDTARPFLEEKLKESLSKAKVEVVEKEKTVISIQDRMKERASDIIGEIEALLDSGEDFSLYDYLKKNEIPAQYAVNIKDYYIPWLAELVEAFPKKDEQLREAYRHMNKTDMKDRIIQIGKILTDADRYGNVTKKTRAPRKPRPVSTEKKLKHLKYQKESAEYKIASVNPEKIIGCQELWTFNTKYKVITVFRAIDRGGLQFNRSSITGYDESSSISKGTGRKPEPILDKIQKGGKLILKNIMGDLKTDKALQSRINENTILLRVVL